MRINHYSLDNSNEFEKALMVFNEQIADESIDSSFLSDGGLKLEYFASNDTLILASEGDRILGMLKYSFGNYTDYKYEKPSFSSLGLSKYESEDVAYINFIRFLNGDVGISMIEQVKSLPKVLAIFLRPLEEDRDLFRKSDFTPKSIITPFDGEEHPCNYTEGVWPSILTYMTWKKPPVKSG